MEDLSDWELFKDSHEAGTVDMEVAANLGHLLAAMHQMTSKSRVSPAQWQKLGVFRLVMVTETRTSYFKMNNGLHFFYLGTKIINHEYY